MTTLSLTTALNASPNSFITIFVTFSTTSVHGQLNELAGLPDNFLKHQVRRCQRSGSRLHTYIRQPA
jgi:hypothetical protein